MLKRSISIGFVFTVCFCAVSFINSANASNTNDINAEEYYINEIHVEPLNLNTIESPVEETVSDVYIEVEPEIEEQTEQESSEEIEEAETTIEETAEVEESYTSKYVPSDSGFKSYMSYKAITSKSSPQYKLQQQAYTGEYGIRMVDDRYCIALGSYYTTNIGTRVDVVMENGSVLKCILSDQKDNKHTDSQNIRAKDGSIVEFVVDKKLLHKSAKQMGDISYADAKFSGEISEIRIYE